MEGMRGATCQAKAPRAAGCWSRPPAVLALFVSQHVYSTSWSRPSPAPNRHLLGFYLMVTNLLEVVIEVAFTPRLIHTSEWPAPIWSTRADVPVLHRTGVAPGLPSAVGARSTGAAGTPCRPPSGVHNALPPGSEGGGLS